MKKIDNCKIVHDLLPSYIDGLTNQETNKYIEEHITKCSKCTEKLKVMNGDIKLEKINQNKEINYLKKLRRRTKLIIFSSLLICIFFSIFIDWKADIEVEKRAREISNPNNITHMIATRTSIKDGRKVKAFRIYTFNKEGICIDMRGIYYNLTKEEVNVMYNSSKDLTAITTNIKINDNQFYYNDSTYNGMTIEEVKEFLSNEKPNYEIYDM